MVASYSTIKSQSLEHTFDLAFPARFDCAVNRKYLPFIERFQNRMNIRMRISIHFFPKLMKFYTAIYLIAGG